MSRCRASVVVRFRARSLERDARRIPVLFISGYTNDALLLRGASRSTPPSFPNRSLESLRLAVRRAIEG
ncbi:MAG: hypothetical protein IPN47_12485 [Gemmatimonadetes bacterium]|nr:hypothetical protein [Gemmatimonadota bacterium]